MPWAMQAGARRLASHSAQEIQRPVLQKEKEMYYVAPSHTVRFMGSCHPSGIEPLSWLSCSHKYCTAAGMCDVASRL